MFEMLIYSEEQNAVRYNCLVVYDNNKDVHMCGGIASLGRIRWCNILAAY